MNGAENIIQILKELDGVDSTSGRPNGNIIAAIKKYFSENFSVDGYIIHDVPSHYIDGSHSLIIQIGPEHLRGQKNALVIPGHIDVVSVEGQDWDSDPFVVTERNGAIIRRGSTDMLGQVCTVFAALPIWLELYRQNKLERPIVITLSYDEESGMRGVREILDYNKTHHSFPEPLGCIVIEPTNMLPVLEHRGATALDIIVHGKASHSGYPLSGVNAGNYLRKILAFIDQEFALLSDASNVLSEFNCMNCLYQAGEARNIISNRATVEYFFRVDPKNSVVATLIEKANAFVANTIIPQMKTEFARVSFVPDHYVEIKQFDACPPFFMKPSHPFATILQSDKGYGVMMGATEASYWMQAGVPAVILGPGSLATAHQANECIAMQDLNDGYEFFAKRLPDLISRE